MRRGWLWLPVLAVVLAGLFRLRFDTEPLALLPSDVPSIAALRDHQRLFPGSRELVVTLESEAPDHLAAFAEALAVDLRSAPDLVAGARWRAPFRDSLVENVAWMWMQRPRSELLALMERWEPRRFAEELAGVRERMATSLDPMDIARAGYDPAGLLSFPGATRGGLSGGDGEDAGFADATGSFRIVLVEPVRPAMPYREATLWLERVRQRIAAVEARFRSANPGVRLQVAYTGGPAFLTEVANGMEGDLQSSLGATVAAIALLFWFSHRSLRPLGLLLAGLGLTFVATLALGGLVLGTLNVISCGFGAVMMGLVVDYGLVGYQELRANPGRSLAALRGEVLPGIAWSAVTTAGTFLSLGFAGLPGLAELGYLTAIGLAVGAAVMLFWFLPRVHASTPPASNGTPAPAQPDAAAGRWAAVATVIVVSACAAILFAKGWPRTEGGAAPLRPRRSPAYEAMARMQERLGGNRVTSWLLVDGRDPVEVRDRMTSLRPALERLKAEGRIETFRTPSAFWPDPAAASTNRDLLRPLSARAALLPETLEAAGFADAAEGLVRGVTDVWRRWDSAGVPLWPDNEGARWLAGVFGARRPDGSWVGLATVESASEGMTLTGLPQGVAVAGWDRIGPDLLGRVRGRVAWLTAAIGVVLAGCLWLAFRRWIEVLLALAALSLSFFVLIALMSLLGASWNLLNLVAVPLLLGTSVDSAIHVQLALRRHQGDLRAMRQSTGRALLLCAGANVAGFGSLAWSSNAGLASLDLVCAGGVLCVMAVMLLLLPGWWLRWAGPAAGDGSAAGPSALYGGGAWALASALVRCVPCRLLVGPARVLGRLHAALRPERRRLVAANLQPLLGDDARAADRAAWRCYAEFAEKLVHLWRLESGADDGGPLKTSGDWGAFEKARAEGRGILLVTPHLGNWELGGPLLAGFGVRPLVLSAEEPDPRLTAARAAARARFGVDTLVVGSDPFAFVGVIRRLQEGGVVALLVDRPVAGTGVEVTLFGRPFLASVAAAELARATGCRILPVYVVREGRSHRAHALEPVEYDRASLGNRAARQELTGRILRVFEPALRQFPDQWFHFIPVWKEPPR